jgi:integrase
MLAQKQNVTRINQHSTVFSHIQSYLRNIETKSVNTKMAYEKDIRDFFIYTRNKDIEQLIEEDLVFNNSDMEDYQTYLHNFVQKNGQKLANSTIKRKIKSVIALYRKLKRKGFNVEPDMMDVDFAKVNSKKIGFLTAEEIEHMLIISDKEELKAFILLALHTSMRRDALLELKWNQIQPKHDEKGWYIINTIDKGKQDFKEIHESVYDVLLNNKSDDEYVFKIPRSTLGHQFRALCKKAGIEEYRNVSIHSLRKFGIDFINQTDGLHAAQAQATHSSPTVTSEIYTQKPKNLAARRLIDNGDNSVFDELSREELLELVNGFGNGIGYQLRESARKIVDGR